MNVIIDINDITKRNIQYYDATTNTVLDDSTFIRIGYSNKWFTTNGLFIYTSFHITKVDKYFNKIKYIYDYHNNRTLIETLITLEKNILDNINIPGIVKTYRLKEQLQTGTISVFDLDDEGDIFHTNGLHRLTLKLSGVWITQNNLGLTYKFLKSIYPSVEK